MIVLQVTIENVGDVFLRHSVLFSINLTLIPKYVFWHTGWSKNGTMFMAP